MIGDEQYEKRNARGERLWKRRSVEKSKSRLFHLAWKSRKKRGIPTFPQPRLLLDTFLWWTQWFRPKPAQLAPFITGANIHWSMTR